MFLSACSDTDVVQDIEYTIDGANAEFVEPQSNIRDFLIQDYNVKEVTDVEIDELESFDTAGPEYSGITEIVRESQVISTEELDNSKKGSAYVSTYHVFDPVESRKNIYICLKPEVVDDVKSILKATAFYKSNEYTDATNVNLMLKDAAEYVSGTSKAAKKDKEELKTALRKMISKSLITNGYQQATKEKFYLAERDVCNLLRQKLSASGFSCVVSDGNVLDRLTVSEVAENASKSGASCLVLVSSATQYAANAKSNKGWCVYYSANDGETTKELATILYEKLGKGTTKVASTEASCELKDSKKTFKGLREVEEYYGRADYFSILNHSTIPTVIVCMGVKDKDSNTLTDSLEMDFATAINAAIVEWSKR